MLSLDPKIERRWTKDVWRQPGAEGWRPQLGMAQRKEERWNVAYASKPCFIRDTATLFGTLREELYHSTANGSPAADSFVGFTRFDAGTGDGFVVIGQPIVTKQDALVIMASNPEAVRRDELPDELRTQFDQLCARVADRAGAI